MRNSIIRHKKRFRCERDEVELCKWTVSNESVENHSGPKENTSAYLAELDRFPHSSGHPLLIDIVFLRQENTHSHNHSPYVYLGLIHNWIGSSAVVPSGQVYVFSYSFFPSLSLDLLVWCWLEMFVLDEHWLILSLSEAKTLNSTTVHHLSRSSRVVYLYYLIVSEWNRITDIRRGQHFDD